MGFLSRPILAAFDRLSGMLDAAIPKLLKEKEVTEEFIEDSTEASEENTEISEERKPNFDKTRYAELIGNMRPKIRPYIQSKILNIIIFPFKTFSQASAAITLFIILIIYIF